MHKTSISTYSMCTSIWINLKFSTTIYNCFSTLISFHYIRLFIENREKICLYKAQRAPSNECLVAKMKRSQIPIIIMPMFKFCIAFTLHVSYIIIKFCEACLSIAVPIWIYTQWKLSLHRITQIESNRLVGMSSRFFFVNVLFELFVERTTHIPMFETQKAYCAS